MPCPHAVSSVNILLSQRSISVYEFCMNDSIGAHDLSDGLFPIRQVPSAKDVERGLSRLLADYSIPSVLLITDNGKY